MRSSLHPHIRPILRRLHPNLQKPVMLLRNNVPSFGHSDLTEGFVGIGLALLKMIGSGDEHLQFSGRIMYIPCQLYVSVRPRRSQVAKGYVSCEGNAVDFGGYVSRDGYFHEPKDAGHDVDNCRCVTEVVVQVGKVCENPGDSFAV